MFVRFSQSTTLSTLISVLQCFDAVGWATGRTFRVLHGTAAPRYLGPLVPVRSLPGRRSLCSAGTNCLLVPLVKQSTVSSRAFPTAGPKTWNALPKDETSS